MNLVALETATAVCSVALWIDGGVVVEAALNRPRAHAENLVPLISDVLRYGGIAARDLDAVAVSAGPGSFTGLRIGASTAKGLASAVDAGLVAVPSLEALAYSAAGAVGVIDASDILLAVFDARRDEVFAAAFRRQADGSLGVHRETAAVSLVDLGDWLGMVAGTVFLAGDGSTKWAAAWGDEMPRVRLLSDEVVRPSAASVARLGAERLARGETVDVAEFEPFYLKEFVAKMPTTSAFAKLPF